MNRNNLDLDIFEKMEAFSLDWTGHDKKLVKDVITRGNQLVERHKENYKGLRREIKRNILSPIVFPTVMSFLGTIVCGILLFFVIILLSYSCYNSATRKIDEAYNDQITEQKNVIIREGYHSPLNDTDIENFLERYKDELPK